MIHDEYFVITLLSYVHLDLDLVIGQTNDSAEDYATSDVEICHNRQLRCPGRMHFLPHTTYICLGYNAESLTWDDARDHCWLQERADLARVPDPRVNRYIKKHFTQGGDSIWIGLNDRRLEGSYTWGDADVSETFYQSWAPGEPHLDPAANCVALSKMGWTVKSCDYHLPSLCMSRLIDGDTPALPVLRVPYLVRGQEVLEERRLTLQCSVRWTREARIFWDILGPGRKQVNKTIERTDSYKSLPLDGGICSYTTWSEMHIDVTPALKGSSIGCFTGFGRDYRLDCRSGVDLDCAVTGILDTSPIPTVPKISGNFHAETGIVFMGSTLELVCRAVMGKGNRKLLWGIHVSPSHIGPFVNQTINGGIDQNTTEGELVIAFPEVTPGFEAAIFTCINMDMDKPPFACKLEQHYCTMTPAFTVRRGPSPPIMDVRNERGEPVKGTCRALIGIANTSLVWAMADNRSAILLDETSTYRYWDVNTVEFETKGGRFVSSSLTLYLDRLPKNYGGVRVICTFRDYFLSGSRGCNLDNKFCKQSGVLVYKVASMEMKFISNVYSKVMFGVLICGATSAAICVYVTLHIYGRRRQEDDSSSNEGEEFCFTWQQDDRAAERKGGV